MDQPPQPLALYQHSSFATLRPTTSVLGDCEITPLPSVTASRLDFVFGDQNDSSSSTVDEEWPRPASRTNHRISFAQQTAASSNSNMGCRIPPRFIPNPHFSGMTVRFIVSQYEPLLELIFFNPAQVHMEFIRGRFISRIVSSSVAYWSMYLGARIFQTLHQDGDHTNVHGYIPWLNRFERLCMTSNNDRNLDDLMARLSGALELMFLKYVTANANSGYSFMHRMAPTFMQIACADPSLWPRAPTSSGVSLAHALVSDQYELGRFIFIDAISGLTFGTPPLIEYDTSHPAIRPHQSHPLEWVHGCPAEFTFSIVQINTWRARNLHRWAEPGVVWKEIEAATWTWRSRCDYGPERDSWKVVARFATQECWRHAVLIYLYLVCATHLLLSLTVKCLPPRACVV
ncbi:hypothetical protein FS749_008315 [Ceratobasidium sp. UAMH 11750]|nr:hypothetical protein FS749_008315 [Ceratobasidium sp. UAMH 11750]